ncbi:unnamed protein product [Cylindrotheca closterium]|uniref:RNI-like superfamily protein n=1 Tax=Cylindrotheca closterium TaxID=2856 RepID=A0AAD2G0D7_9STRA|nr:unnamed protein product [Cylindrotheca closterium]
MEHHRKCRFNFAWSHGYHPNYRFGRAELSDARHILIEPPNYPGSFRIRNQIWDAALFDVFVNLFDHFASENIIWEEFDFFFMSTYDKKSWKFIRPLLQRASSLGIYKKLRVEMQLLFGPENPPDTTKEFLLEGIDRNENLQAIELISVHTKSSDPLVRGEHPFQMSKGDCIALNRLSEATDSLKELSLNGIGMLQTMGASDGEGEQERIWYHPLCEGLAKNSSLETIKLDFVGCRMTDMSLAQLVMSISNIPTLKSLTLNFPCQAGPLTSAALQDLLLKCHSLTDLVLNGPISVSSSNHEEVETEKESVNGNAGPLQLDASQILHGIQESRSLKSLKLQRIMNADWSLSRIFEAIWSCQTLCQIEVDDNVEIMQDLEALISMERFDRHMRLILPVDQYLQDYESENAVEVLQGFLFKHPEMRLKPPSVLSKRARNKRTTSNNPSGFFSQRFMALMEESMFLSKSLKHICDFNWHGRYLMHTPAVPLGLWPRVMERATTNPSVLYELLKSPALVSWGGGATES